MQEGRKAVGTVCVKAANSSVAVFSLKNVKLWSPESPFLYDVVYQVLDRDGTVVDEVVSYVGMRKVHIEVTEFISIMSLVISVWFSTRVFTRMEFGQHLQTRH